VHSVKNVRKGVIIVLFSLVIDSQKGSLKFEGAAELTLWIQFNE
jgi:hypothetical protein